jgi:hypothetical protein
MSKRTDAVVASTIGIDTGKNTSQNAPPGSATLRPPRPGDHQPCKGRGVAFTALRFSRLRKLPLEKIAHHVRHPAPGNRGSCCASGY